MAKAAVRAGLSWSPDRQLPVQGFVAAHERARLVFHARRELPRVTAVASQVMVVDSRLAEAEETLERAVQHRLSMAAVAPSGAADGSATPATGGHAAEQPYQPTFGVLLEQPSRRQVLGPWSQAAVLPQPAQPSHHRLPPVGEGGTAPVGDGRVGHGGRQAE